MTYYEMRKESTKLASEMLSTAAEFTTSVRLFRLSILKDLLKERKCLDDGTYFSSSSILDISIKLNMVKLMINEVKMNLEDMIHGSNAIIIEDRSIDTYLEKMRDSQEVRTIDGKEYMKAMFLDLFLFMNRVNKASYAEALSDESSNYDSQRLYEKIEKLMRKIQSINKKGLALAEEYENSIDDARIDDILYQY